MTGLQWHVSLLIGCAMTVTLSALVWYEERPSLKDPCSHIVVGPRRGYMITIRPPRNCSGGGGVRWYATYGRIHVHLHFDKEKDFELCLTSGSTNKVYVWWEKNSDSWEPITFPLDYDEVKSPDMCRKSVNSTMNIFLEPPWGFVFYESYAVWNITFIDKVSNETKPSE